MKETFVKLIQRNDFRFLIAMLQIVMVLAHSLTNDFFSSLTLGCISGILLGILIPNPNPYKDHD